MTDARWYVLCVVMLLWAIGMVAAAYWPDE